MIVLFLLIFSDFFYELPMQTLAFTTTVVKPHAVVRTPPSCKDKQKALRRDCIYNVENTNLERGVSGVYLHLLHV